MLRGFRFLVFLLALLGPDAGARSVSAATEFGQLTELIPDEGAHLVRLRLRDHRRFADGAPTAEVVLQNQQARWYMVHDRSPLVRGANLKSWVLVPPCGTAQSADFTCAGGEVVLGRMPLRPGAELKLLLDGEIAGPVNELHLGIVWAAEVLWRVGFEEPLPTHAGLALASLRGEAGPELGAIIRIRDVRQKLEDRNALGSPLATSMLADAVGIALQRPAVRAFLVKQGVPSELVDQASNLSDAVREERLGRAVGELPFGRVTRADSSVGPSSGRVHAEVPRLRPADGSLIRGSGSTLYLMEHGKRRPIPDWDTYLSSGGADDLSNTLVLADYELGTVPYGDPLPSVLGSSSSAQLPLSVPVAPRAAQEDQTHWLSRFSAAAPLELLGPAQPAPPIFDWPGDVLVLPRHLEPFAHFTDLEAMGNQERFAYRLRVPGYQLMRAEIGGVRGREAYASNVPTPGAGWVCDPPNLSSTGRLFGYCANPSGSGEFFGALDVDAHVWHELRCAGVVECFLDRAKAQYFWVWGAAWYDATRDMSYFMSVTPGVSDAEGSEDWFGSPLTYRAEEHALAMLELARNLVSIRLQP